MTNVKTKDFLKRLFMETQDESDMDSDLEGCVEVWEDLDTEVTETNKAPLLKALKELGVDTDEENLQPDPSGFCITTEDSDEFSVMKDVLLKPEKLHILAEIGWVAYVCGDEGETEEPRKYKVKFLELDLNPTDFDKKADKDVPTSAEDSEKKLEKIIKTSREVEMGDAEKDVPMGKKTTGVEKTKPGGAVKHAIKDSREVSRLLSNLLKEDDGGDVFMDKLNEIQALALQRGFQFEAEMDAVDPFVSVTDKDGSAWDAPIENITDLIALETRIRKTSESKTPVHDIMRGQSGGRAIFSAKFTDGTRLTSHYSSEEEFIEAMKYRGRWGEIVSYTVNGETKKGTAAPGEV